MLSMVWASVVMMCRAAATTAPALVWTLTDGCIPSVHDSPTNDHGHSFAAPAVVFFFFWVFDVNFFGPYLPDRGGTAAEWAAGLLTGGALVIAALAYGLELRGRREREESDRQTAANQVAASIDSMDEIDVYPAVVRRHMAVRVLVSNHGDYPIRQVRVTVNWPTPFFNHAEAEKPSGPEDFDTFPLIRPNDPHWYAFNAWFDDLPANEPDWWADWKDVWGDTWRSVAGETPTRLVE